MSSNPEQISRLSLLLRALILTLVMALMSGRLEVKKFSSLSRWQSSTPSHTTNWLHYLNSYSQNDFTRS